MTARDELADIIAGVILDEKGVAIGKVADAILGAGYTKPRTINTLEELDALGTKSIVMDRDGYGWQKDIRLEGYWWGIARDTLASTRNLVDFGPFEVLRNAHNSPESEPTA